MQRSKHFILTMIAVALALAGCDRDTLYFHYESTPLLGWERTDTLAFSDIAVKASSNYKEEIGLRINDDFPFQSLFLVVEQEIRPHNIMRTDTLNCRLTDKNGMMKGRGLRFYQYNVHLTTLHLNAGDTLNVRIRHHMKRESLPGIANIGIKLSK